MTNEVEFPSGPLVGFIQFLVYADQTRQAATPLGDPIWCDMTELMSSHYTMGTSHSIAIPANSAPVSYTVAMIPYVGYVDHPDHEKKVLRRLIYLIPSELWPLVEPLTNENLTRSLFPNREAE